MLLLKFNFRIFVLLFFLQVLLVDKIYAKVSDTLSISYSDIPLISDTVISKDSIGKFPYCRFYNNGIILKEGRWNGLKFAGPYKEYHLNGKLALAGDFSLTKFGEKAGKRIGNWIFYDTSGFCIRVEDYDGTFVSMDEIVKLRLHDTTCLDYGDFQKCNQFQSISEDEKGYEYNGKNISKVEFDKSLSFLESYCDSTLNGKALGTYLKIYKNEKLYIECRKFYVKF